MTLLLKKLYNISLVFSLFPWVSFGLIEGGIQPFFIVMMFLTLLTHLLIKQSFRRAYFLLVIPLLFFFMNYLNIGSNELVREFIAYFVLVISFIFFIQYLNLYGFPKNILISILWIWIIAGLVQLIFDPKIFEFLVHSRGSEDRGVTAFASEPSFFGLHIAAIVSLIIFFSQNKRIILVLFLGILGVTLSASVVGAYFFLSLVGTAMFHKKLITIRLAVFVSLLFVLAYISFLSDMRFGLVFNYYLDYGFHALLVNDESASSRTFQSLTPFLLAYDNLFMPSNSSVIDQISQVDSNSVYIDFLSNDNKIGSYLGRFVFHWGIFFIIPYLAILIFSSLISLRLTLSLIMLPIALFPAISPAYPIIPFIFAYFYFCFQYRSSFSIDKSNQIIFE